MQSNRQTKIVAIVALCVAVLGLTLGFAAFSNTLTISSSATVKPDSSDFEIKVSGEEGNAEAATSVGVATGGAEAGVATIVNNGNSTVTGVTAEFNAPGQSVTYELYGHNVGQYVAYWKTLSVADVSGAGTPIVCTATADDNGQVTATDSLVQAACSYITYDVDVEIPTGSNVGTLSLRQAGAAQFNKSLDLASTALAKGDVAKITITIKYNEAADGTYNRADGPFAVSFGDATFTYSSAA